MSNGKQTQSTEIQRPPQYNDFLNQVFGDPGSPVARGLSGILGMPYSGGAGGVGLQGLEELFGSFQPPTSPLQRQASNQVGQYLNQEAPEMQAYKLAMGGLSPILQGQGQYGNVANAMFPIFQRNLQEGMSQLGAAAPGRFSSAFLQQGTDLTGRAMQDYNLFIQQARQQDIANQMQAAMTLGTLGQAAGMNPMQRALGAGQFGLAESQFGGQGLQNKLAMQQFLLQMLSNPTGQTTTISGGGGLGSLAGGILGTAAGSFLGPVGGAAGATLGRNLFGGGGGGAPSYNYGVPSLYFGSGY